MKKTLLSLACIVSFVLAFTGCNGHNDYYYYVSSYLTGIYTSETATDTSTVILMPSGYKDMIMLQVQNGEEVDSIYLTPTVDLNETSRTGSFSDSESGWQGNLKFATLGNSVALTMTNQKTGKTLPVINLTKAQFGTTIAGRWADPDNPSSNCMRIYLCRPGFPDMGYITLAGVQHAVYVYGPSNKYGNGYMDIRGAGGWYRYDYELSPLNSKYEQTIYITRGSESYEMTRLIGQ